MDEKFVARFWRKVDKAGSEPAHVPGIGPCWNFTAKARTHGYGIMGWGQRTVQAHRVSWMIAHGDPPNGLCVLHKCDNRTCVNPEHLFLGTRKENLEDMRAKGRGSKPPLRRGAAHPMTPFTEQDIRGIRARASAGENQSAMAREFGVSSAAINSIVHRRSWTHVE